MVVCRNCNIPMKNVMSFSKDKRQKFLRCPKCYGETKHSNMQDGELTFEKYLNKELKKGNF